MASACGTVVQRYGFVVRQSAELEMLERTRRKYPRGTRDVARSIAILSEEPPRSPGSPQYTLRRQQFASMSLDQVPPLAALYVCSAQGIQKVSGSRIIFGTYYTRTQPGFERLELRCFVYT